MKTGIVYVNTSHSDGLYIREAERSADSFRAFIPDAEFVLCTDDPDFTSKSFDKAIHADFTIPACLEGTDHKNGQMVGKLSVLPTLDYERVAYCGSDMYALSPDAASIFDLLDHFDMCVAHAPVRINTALGNSPLPMIPKSFPEFNCDLVVWRKNRKVLDFLESWRDMYLTNELGHPHDQGAFRYLAYFSDLRIAVLPPEYNYRSKQFSDQVVILQNREALPQYLGQKPRKRGVASLPRRALGRVRRMLR